jgi:phosphoribosylanthranilate isomerase
MTWIKICGTTNLEDALLGVDAGADALGFVFYEKSPRYISPEAARKIIAKLPAAPEKIGVFANESVEKIRDNVQRGGLTGVQLHGDEDPIFVNQLADGWSLQNERGSIAIRIIKALPVREGFEELAENFPAWIRNFLLDTSVGNHRGGTGRVFDWSKASDFVKRYNTTVVAGGLNPSNVSEAIRILKPWGVDVVSGVEASLGKKDPEKVWAFIKAVRQSEKII